MERFRGEHHRHYGLTFFDHDKPLTWSVPGLTFESPVRRVGELGIATVYGVREYPWPISREDRALLRTETWGSARSLVHDDNWIEPQATSEVKACCNAFSLHLVLRPAARIPVFCRLWLPSVPIALVSELAMVDDGQGSGGYSVGRAWDLYGAEDQGASALYVPPAPALLSRFRFSFHASIGRD